MRQLLSGILSVVLVSPGFAPGKGLAEPPRTPKTSKSTKSLKTVRLPEAGSYPAIDLFPLVTKLSGLRVRAAKSNVAEKRVEISIELAGQRLSYNELALLLAAHGVFLHSHESKKKGSFLVASSSRSWKPRKKSIHTQGFDVSPRRFSAALREVETLLEKRNQNSRGRKTDSVVLPVRATGRLLVRTPHRRILREVENLIAKMEVEGDPRRDRRNHFYSFRPENFPSRILESRLRGFLDENELKRVHLVRPRGRNALLVRTTPPLWKKIRRILTLADNPGVEWSGEAPPGGHVEPRRNPPSTTGPENPH